MTYCFDLDGTICSDTQGDYNAAKPFPEIVASINQLHSEGHHILVFTARGSGTGQDWRGITERQLAAWGVSYDYLYFGKPAADVYVDDKAVNISEYRMARLGRLSPDTAPAVFPPFPSERN
jgi:hypothetical protein